MIDVSVNAQLIEEIQNADLEPNLYGNFKLIEGIWYDRKL